MKAGLVHRSPAPQPPPRAVVIGAAGFIGATIVRQLRAAQVATVGLSRAEVDLLAADAADRLAERLAGGDAVVFVSAETPARSAGQLLANLRMAEAACRAFKRVPPAHLLYVSSDAVYADDANPVREGSAVAPSTMHGMMHAGRELIFRTEHGGPMAVLRPTLVYGAADPHAGYGPNRFRRQGLKGEPIAIFGDGEEKRDHVAVEDVAALAVHIVLHSSEGTLNAATGVATSFRDLAGLVAAQFTPPAAVISVPRTAPRPHLLHRFFDIAACLKAFPQFRFEPVGAGIARVHREIEALA